MSDHSVSGVTLRDIRASDSPQWIAWLNDLEIMGLMDRVDRVSSEAHEAFFRSSMLDNPAARWFAIERHGKYIGNVWLWNIHSRHRRAEVRILIGDRAAWGTGSGTEALSAIIAHATSAMGLHKIYAFVHERNQRSKRAFLRAGFVEEVCLRQEAVWEGRYTDVWRLVFFAEPQI